MWEQIIIANDPIVAPAQLTGIMVLFYFVAMGFVALLAWVAVLVAFITPLLVGQMRYCESDGARARVCVALLILIVAPPQTLATRCTTCAASAVNAPPRPVRRLKRRRLRRFPITCSRRPSQSKARAPWTGTMWSRRAVRRPLRPLCRLSWRMTAALSCRCQRKCATCIRSCPFAWCSCRRSYRCSSARLAPFRAPPPGSCTSTCCVSRMSHTLAQAYTHVCVQLCCMRTRT